MLQDLWSTFRDRLLSNPDFHRWALKVPVVRAVARRRARELFDLTAGFVYSQVLLAAVRVGLLQAVADGPCTVAEIGSRCGLDDEAALRLLRAAAPLGLVELRTGGRYGLGYLGAPLLANPGLQQLIRHHAMLYEDLADPLPLLRGERPPTRLSQYWSYAQAADPAALPPDDVSDYSDLMAASQSAVAADVIASYDFSRHRCVMDIGGGEGVFAAAVAAANPEVDVIVADLPPVAERARQNFSSLGLADRADAWGGDFLTDPLPDRADIITLVRVVHDHDDAAVGHLFAAVHEALTPGGVLLIAEQLAGTAGAETVGDTYFGLYLLAMGSGRPRTVEEMNRLLNEHGFSSAVEIATPLPLQVRLLITRPRAG